MWTNEAGWTNPAGGKKENACAEMYGKGFDIYQTISETIENGRYKLSNQAFYNNADAGNQTYLYANSDQTPIAILNANGEGTAANMAGASDAFTAGQYVNSVETFVSNGSLKVGIKNATSAGNAWNIMNNFHLEYLGQCVMDYAAALPDGGDMAADTWYYFDIAAAADNYTATATTLGNIICVTDGYTLTSAATGTVTLTATDNDLSATRYYVKSSSANNLVVGVAAYSYSISEATVDKAYIQAGNTVTVSYTVSTNDPNATLTQSYSGVTFGGNAVTCVATASGFTFTVPDVTANTDYTLSIPEGAIKYGDNNKNAAQNITLKTPALFDGTYYLRVAATYDGSSEGTSAAVGKYMARGMNYGTHATLDKYGLPVQITTNGDNATTIQAYDTKRYFFHANSWDCYADQASLAATSYFTVTLNNGKLLIHNNSMAAGTYLKYNTSAVNDANIPVFDDGTGTNNGLIIMWTTEDASSHASVMQSYKDNQAATAAAAAYASGNYASLNGITEVSALEAELDANYIKGDFVSPSAIESVSEKYQGDQPGSGNTTETVYSNTINITTPGFYKFSMQAFYRAGSNDVTQNMHTNGVDFPPVVLFFGDSETQIKSVYDEGSASAIEEGWGDVTYNGQHYPNNMSASLKMFQSDKYHNDVYFYASAAGEYTYGVKYMGWACDNAQWFIYSPESVEITSYAAAADAADYTALQDAIDTYDDATWGFEAGEYAPYNNVEAIKNIDAAKAINKEETNSKLLVNSMTLKLALSAANAAEVNAFYDGDFSECAEDNASPLDYTPSGWTASDNMRMMLKNSETYPGLADASATTAMMSWSGGITYGETTGYTMPLKANTVYTLKLKAAGWNDESRSGISVSILKESDGMALYDMGTPDRDIKAAKDWNTAGMTAYEIVFATGAAGNYVFHIQSGNNMVITDFEIKKAASQVLEFADNADVPSYAPGTYPQVKITRTMAADRWYTAVYPFVVNGIDQIATLDSYSDQNLKFVTSDASTANEPFLMRSASAKSNITLNNVVVAAADADEVTKGDASLIGTYTQVTKQNENESSDKYYVISENNIHPVSTSSTATINPYRAYIKLANQSTGAARSLGFFVDEESTNIEGISVETATNDKVYNLNGQRVAAPAKGLYIVNGKKFVVK